MSLKNFLNVLYCVLLLFSLTHLLVLSILYTVYLCLHIIWNNIHLIYVNRTAIWLFSFLVCLICILHSLYCKGTHVQRTFSLSIAMKMALSTRFVFCCHNWICWRIQTFTCTHTDRHTSCTNVHFIGRVGCQMCITNNAKW